VGRRRPGARPRGRRSLSGETRRTGCARCCVRPRHPTPKRETRNPEPEIRNTKSKAERPVPLGMRDHGCTPESRNPRPETQNPRPETKKDEERKTRSSLGAYHPENAGGSLHDAAAQREGNDLKHFNDFPLKRCFQPRPESGFDCLICAEFTRQWFSIRFERGNDQQRFF